MSIYESMFSFKLDPRDLVDQVQMERPSLRRPSASRSFRRRPFCAQCTNHGLRIDLKGHKRHCPFRSCDCSKCLVTSERRKINAKQIALRREMADESLSSGMDMVQNIQEPRARTPQQNIALNLPFSLGENATFLKSFLEVVYPRLDLVTLLVKSLLKTKDGDVNQTLIELKRDADAEFERLKVMERLDR